jgi:hypothetical protein
MVTRGYFETERYNFKDTVYTNVLLSIRTLIQYVLQEESTSEHDRQIIQEHIDVIDQFAQFTKVYDF